ncbi:MAG TPA: hypothetical protein VKW78_18735 [Terriglobales bacterium]|nr:hypothetical protein [Terriglobales bacterium]
MRRQLLRFNLFALLLLSTAPLLNAQNVTESSYQQLRWRLIGPFRGGRTRAVSGVPSQPNVFYVGAVDGGVWKSDDYGRTWSPIFDDQPTQSIGAIAVAPSDPNIVYVASGEGLHRPDLSVGDGIYKSTDAGKTWTHLGLRDSQQIPALVIDPNDPNRLFAAVLGHPYGPNEERGIFRSTDGGQSWEKVLYKDPNTGGADVKMDPSNPQIVYATLWEGRQGPWEDNNEFAGTGGGLFKSTDGGNTWHQLTRGLPNNLVHIYVAIAASQPNRLYATFSTTEKAEYASGKGLGFYRSDDSGESWYKATDDPRPAMLIGGGDLPVPAVDPTNPDVVYSTSIVTVKSTDGGKTWMSWRGAPGGDDYQNIWINPNNSKVILLVSDQGALVTVNGGDSWSSWYNQPTAQLYHVATTNTFPYRVCGGQQESGSVCTLSRGNDGEITFRDWHPVGVIEYGYVAPDPLDADIVYGAGRTEVSKFHWSTGQVQNISPIPVRDGYRVDRTEPIVFSPVDPHQLFYASNVLFKTTDGGQAWKAISPDLTRPDPGVPASVDDVIKLNPKSGKQRGAIYAVAPSFKDVNTIWAGTDDGLVWITRDGGSNWNNITPPGLIPWSKVTQIDASHFDDNTAYVSVSRFRINDLKPYIYRTHDGGKTWQSIVSGLPDQPVDTVRADPVRKGLLFAGTETGVYVSFDDGDHWQSLQLNLPHSSMRDLAIHDDDLVVATHGRSFWILDDITPLRQLTGEIENESGHLFQPAPAIRVRRDTNTDTPLPPDEPAGQNPPDGAILDYYIGQQTSGPVTLEIFDQQNKLVRRYASTDKPYATEDELAKQLIPLYWIRMPQVLPADPGMHRWVWDLRYAPPTATRHGFPISAVPHDTPREPQGPLVLPGQYTVKLTAGGKTFSAPLVVKMDPRVKATPADLQRQSTLGTQLATMLSDSSEAVLEAHSVREQMEKLTARASEAPNSSLKTTDEKLKDLLEGNEATSARSEKQAGLEDLNETISSLYSAVWQADQAPTKAQSDAAAKAESQLRPLMQKWSELKAGLSALNTQLRGANLPEIRPEWNLQPDNMGVDEE